MFDGTNTNLNFRIAMRAAELIERDGLCKGKVRTRLADDTVLSRCWMGALSDASAELQGNRAFGEQFTKLAWEILQIGPFGYNDAPETTAADVASLLRETARRCLVEK